jgi:hypothetical protein
VKQRAPGRIRMLRKTSDPKKLGEERRGFAVTIVD